MQKSSSHYKQSYGQMEIIFQHVKGTGATAPCVALWIYHWENIHCACTLYSGANKPHQQSASFISGRETNITLRR